MSTNSGYPKVRSATQTKRDNAHMGKLLREEGDRYVEAENSQGAYRSYQKAEKFYKKAGNATLAAKMKAAAKKAGARTTVSFARSTMKAQRLPEFFLVVQDSNNLARQITTRSVTSRFEQNGGGPTWTTTSPLRAIDVAKDASEVFARVSIYTRDPENRRVICAEIENGELAKVTSAFGRLLEHP